MFPKGSTCQHCWIKWYSCFLRGLTGQLLKYELHRFNCLSHYDNAKDFSHNFNIYHGEWEQRKYIKKCCSFSLQKISVLGPQQVIFSAIFTISAFCRPHSFMYYRCLFKVQIQIQFYITVLTSLTHFILMCCIITYFPFWS